MLWEDYGKFEISIWDCVCGKRGESKILLHQVQFWKVHHFSRQPGWDHA